MTLSAEILSAVIRRYVSEIEELFLIGAAKRMVRVLWGYQDELRRLTNTVSTIKALRLDADEKQAAEDLLVGYWLRKLDDVIYQADDLLDAVSTEALRREIMTYDKKAKKVRIFFSKSNQLAFLLKIAPKIKAIIEMLDFIKAHRYIFGFNVSGVETRGRGNSQFPTSLVSAEFVIGRVKDKKAVIHRLLDSNVEENVSILPIVGIGGLGKTTLAQLIYNDDQIQKHFDLKMWACVSDIFDVQVIRNWEPEIVQMETSLDRLKAEIDGKKYLLVLDDVWNVNPEKWHQLKVVLMGGASGSRILVTTRTESVARIVGTVESYSLKGLDKDASWSLFKQMAFGKGQEQEENSSIEAIGREILAKCSGVPLAIKTIGSLLQFKKLEAEWYSFKKIKLSEISQNENDILPTLKLSYDHLPLHLKHCFCYCCLYPKDYWFDKSTLIQLWIAQGFVESRDQNACLEDVGNEYFMDLLCRLFFQEAEMDEFGNVIRCKMHDLMHDLAASVAGLLMTTWDDKERYLDEEIRHVSFDYNISIADLTLLKKARRIRTFLRLGGDYLRADDYDAIFSSFKFLRVLDMHKRNIDVVPSAIGKLQYLRYLDLSSNYNIKKLPDSITRLQFAYTKTLQVRVTQ